MERRRFLYSALKTASAMACLPLADLPTVVDGFRGSPQALKKAERPQLALTMDDPTVNLHSTMKWQEANTRILKAIASRKVRAALFVCGMRVDEADGGKLLTAWDQAGHLIGNHTYSHLFYGEQTSYADFAIDFLKNEKIIAPYGNRRRLFRYPFLKEGDTAEKRDKFRALLKERGYRIGHVTIDASDWYVNQRLLHRWETQPKTPVDAYRDFLVAHLLDRAAFYRQLALDLLGRDIRHTLLVHSNTLNALVLPEVMAAFENAGWQWIDASLAFEDPVFRSQPNIVPAGESLVWGLAKESGRFADRLRYPGEDGEYERSKMDTLGL
jgi:peptidoglycan/xylan/chitin deacetylase (PgdA/CDA1 family)